MVMAAGTATRHTRPPDDGRAGGGRDSIAGRLRIEHALSATDVEARPWQPFANGPGVRFRVLWDESATGSFAGILQLAPGAQLRRHFHLVAVHHLYVLSGTCELSGSDRVLGPGAYVFVPAEAQHGIEGTGPDGCTAFFLHLAVHQGPDPGARGPAQ
jgi:quercetin dioxygenase-like cupin family protein